MHVENTGIQLRVRDHARNYLRVCGEYSYFHLMRCPSSELPPRTRRIRTDCFKKQSHTGTTSAHAENTRALTSLVLFHGNYLRARGEYPYMDAAYHTHMELPPRTRRIQLLRQICTRLEGTTSAHAENTAHGELNLNELGNYLRARGEYRKILPGAVI